MDYAYTEGPHSVAACRLLSIHQNQKTEDKIFILLSQEERLKLKEACIFVKRLMDWKFSYKEFYNAVCQSPYLPLEFVWRLHSVGILPLEIYLIQKQNEPKVLTVFYKSIELLCISDLATSDISVWIVSGIMELAVAYVFGECDCNEFPALLTKKIFHVTLENALKLIIETNVDQSFKVKLNPVLLLWRSPGLNSSTFHSFCSFVLKFFITFNPVIKSSNAIDYHMKWFNEDLSVHFSNVISKVFSFLGPINVSVVLHELVKNEEVDWKVLLAIYKTYLTSYNDAASHSINLINDLVKLSLSEMKVDLLCGCFVLIRHGALLDSSHFPLTYCSWFKKNFEDGSTIFSKGELSFKFFMKFLTSLVPNEKEHYLKTHIENAPYLVENCRGIFMDYVTLAKTRLEDLKVKDLSDTILDKVLKSFEATGKIPATVLEASMLHKHHYLTQFLPNLLTPRVLPKTPDTRMKLIEALKINGKIPKHLYERYEDGCRRIVDEDAELYLDDSFDIEIIGPDEQLFDLLRKFQSQISDFRQNAHNLNAVRNCVDQFRAQLHAILKQIDSEEADVQSSICISPNEALVNEKIINEMFVCYSCFQSACSKINESFSQLWSLTSDVLSFPSLKKDLCIYIFRKLTKNAEILDSMLIKSLVSCLASFGLMQCSSVLMLVPEGSESKSLVAAVFDALSLSASSEIQYFYKLSYLYLKNVLSSSAFNYVGTTSSSLPEVISEGLIKKLQFVSIRLNPENQCQLTKLGETHAIYCRFKHLQGLHILQHWIAVSKLTLSEWWEYEINVSQNSDYFTMEQRYKYIQWCILHLFADRDDKVASVKFCCSSLFKFLLSTSNRCECFQKLLKEFVELYPQTCSSAVPSVPWVYDEFYKAVSRLDKSAGNFRSSVTVLLERYLELLCDLPPFVLFEDIEHVKIHYNGSLELSTFINDWFKTYNAEDFSLTQEFTFHVLEGLLFLHNNTDCILGDRIIKDFLSKCHLLTISVFTHFSAVEGKYTKFISKTKNSYLKEYLKEVNMIIKVISEGHSLDPISGMDSLETLDIWAVGFAAVLKEPQLKFKSSYLSYYKPLDWEFFKTAVWFNIAFKVSLRPSDSEASSHPCDNIISAVKILIDNERACYLLPKYYNNFVLHGVLSSSAWCHFCAGVLNVLLAAFPVDVGGKMLTSKTWAIWLYLILENLYECQEKHKILNSTGHFVSIVSEKLEVYKKRIGILCWNFLQDSVVKIRSLLLIAPKESIKQIPQECVMHSDSYLRCFLEAKGDHLF